MKKGRGTRQRGKNGGETPPEAEIKRVNFGKNPE